MVQRFPIGVEAQCHEVRAEPDRFDGYVTKMKRCFSMLVTSKKKKLKGNNITPIFITIN